MPDKTIAVGYHWVTVTKYFKDGDTKEQFISVSSWGERYTINLSELYKKGKYIQEMSVYNLSME